MSNDSAAISAAQIATQRLNEFLASRTKEGLTQAEIAQKAGIPPQYLSDIKRGGRPLTELVARRLGEEFNISYKWLMGTSSSPKTSEIPRNDTTKVNSTWLPLLFHPIIGNPQQNAAWEGHAVEITNFELSRIGSAQFPYVLEFRKNDPTGRLRPGDRILISQSVNPEAEVRIVIHAEDCFLVRRNGQEGWTRVGNGDELDGDCPEVGHCVGIIWSSLS